tara:strand:- start:1640 stop:1897 length:258 start_codon:yes stop_codon:yes gene_type:complete
MWPTLHHDQVVEFRETEPGATYHAGDIVLAKHPMKTDVVVIKRILRVESDGRLFLVGDNPDPTASEDSHNFGPVKPDHVQAVMVR